MSECATIQIKQKSDGRVRIINTSDFDPEIHALPHDEKPESAAKAAKQKTAPVVEPINPDLQALLVSE